MKKNKQDKNNEKWARDFKDSILSLLILFPMS